MTHQTIQDGRGSTQNVSPEQHAAARRAAKKRRGSASTRVTTAEDAAPPRDLNARREVIDRDTRRKQLLNEGCALAVEALKEHACHTFVDDDEICSRFSPEETTIAEAHMRYLFDGSVEHLRAGSLSSEMRTAVRALFVLVCETKHIRNAYGMRAVWYQQVLELNATQLWRCRLTA
jgi:hypothetical protein